MLSGACVTCFKLGQDLPSEGHHLLSVIQATRRRTTGTPLATVTEERQLRQ